MVLFSDGRDECFDADLDGDPAVGPSYGEDPCVVAQRIAGDGVDLRIDRIETVGFGADSAAELELRCIADSTGGSYTAIETPADAREVLPELLAVISSPREAQRLGGTAIVGADSQQGAPDFERLDSGVGDGRFTDTIEMNTEKWYRSGSYGPGPGTFTATAFGLPAQEGIEFFLRMYIPSSDQTFFEDQGDDDAGLPRRPTASIRCPGCSIIGLSDDLEVFWIVSLSSENEALGGTYDLELLTEGPAFGGSDAGCIEPQACWYEEQIPLREAAIEEANVTLAEVTPEESEIGTGVDLDALRTDLTAQETALVTAESDATAAEENAATTKAREAGLQAQADALGEEGTSLLLPILLGLLGLVIGAGSLFIGRKRDEPTPAVVTATEVPPAPSNSDVVGRVSPTAPALEVPERPAAPTSPAAPATPAVAAAQPIPEAETVLPDAETARWERGFGKPTEVGERVGARLEEGVAEGQLEAPDADPPPEEQSEPQPNVVEPEPAEALEVPEQTAPNSGATAAIPAGWYANPEDASQWRWWDGTAWTSHVHSAGGGEVQ